MFLVSILLRLISRKLRLRWRQPHITAPVLAPTAPALAPTAPALALTSCRSLSSRSLDSAGSEALGALVLALRTRGNGAQPVPLEAKALADVVAAITAAALAALQAAIAVRSRSALGFKVPEIGSSDATSDETQRRPRVARLIDVVNAEMRRQPRRSKSALFQS
eukprot:6197839-Pleurochrysis_carterae.AAC.4